MMVLPIDCDHNANRDGWGSRRGDTLLLRPVSPVPRCRTLARVGRRVGVLLDRSCFRRNGMTVPSLIRRDARTDPAAAGCHPTDTAPPVGGRARAGPAAKTATPSDHPARSRVLRAVRGPVARTVRSTGSKAGSIGSIGPAAVGQVISGRSRPRRGPGCGGEMPGDPLSGLRFNLMAACPPDSFLSARTTISGRVRH
jgi:hypothetical protein